MANRLAALLCASFIMFGGIGSALAADSQIYSGVTFKELSALLTDAGATIETLDTNLLRIADGPIIGLGGCSKGEGGKCYEVAILRTFSDVRPTLAAVNKWNYSTTIPEASVNENGNLHLQFWVSGEGLTQRLLLDSIVWFEKAWKSDEAQTFWAPYAKSSPGM